jgi:predicted ATP-dependent endonuclease of OLD family
MKLKLLKIKNFKGIKDLEIDFLSPHADAPRRLTAIMGDNGAGKTTVLQAIALVLSIATRKTRDLSDFEWYGFLPERISTIGNTFVELTIAFDKSEITAVRELFEMWRDSRTSEWAQTHNIIEPADRTEVTLRLENGSVKSPDGHSAYVQLLGRYYIKQLKDSHPRLRNRFKDVGDIFWFDQFRNLGSVNDTGDDEKKAERRSWITGVEQLREYLVGWWGYHTSPNKHGGRDYISELETLFERIFPGTRFTGTLPKSDADTGHISDFYFLLERNQQSFDIAEMSSGEQGVFPLLYEFVRLDISRSIVMIDELELHLHPPQQQALLAALPKLGSDCQFIITTHSPHLEGVISDEDEVRLQGGRLCL